MAPLKRLPVLPLSLLLQHGGRDGGGVLVDKYVPRGEHEVVWMAQVRCEKEERGIHFPVQSLAPLPRQHALP